MKNEDLIRDSKTTLKSLLEYLEIDSQPDMIQGMISVAENTQEQIPEVHQTSNSPTSSIGRWRTDLDEDLQELCNTEFRKALITFGYDPT